ncbi:MAG: CheW domain-containing protein [Magnetococcales bacterium]|nr:CheW domain-containing protein [Magnetococcales bacterium]
MSEQAEQPYAEIIQHAEQQRAQEQQLDVDEETVQLVVFKVEDKMLAIPGCHVRELVPVGEIVYVPGTSELFLGVIPIRGEIASVLYLARLLGLSTHARPRTPSHRILMVVKEEMSTGVLVDAVADIIQTPKSAIQPHPSTLDPQMALLAEGQILFGTEPAPVISVTALFRQLQELCA